MEYSDGSLIIIAALLLDIAVGEKESMPHPVIWMGRIINLAEVRFNSAARGGHKKLSGIILACLLPAVSYLLSSMVLKLAFALSGFAGIILSIVLAYTTLSMKGLKDAAWRVREALDSDDIASAREALSHIVGRKTEELGESEILRATVETVAENTSDGVIAPLFFLVIGGVPLAMAYKAVNTLDSMVGYKNDRYQKFGWASARLDDLANLIPSRLTALMMVAAAFLLRLDWQGAWTIIKRDSMKHPSPNAGWPESATAGALGVRLGGTNFYQDRIESRPDIGDNMNVLERSHIDSVVRLMYVSSIIMAPFSIVLRGLLV